MGEVLYDHFEEFIGAYMFLCLGLTLFTGLPVAVALGGIFPGGASGQPKHHDKRSGSQSHPHISRGQRHRRSKRWCRSRGFQAVRCVTRPASSSWNRIHT